MDLPERTPFSPSEAKSDQVSRVHLRKDDEKQPAARANASNSRRKKTDNIFASFGKEHGSDGVTTVDGKIKVNYKRFWNSEADIGRWQQALAHNKRHSALAFEARERSGEDMRKEVSDLTDKHNALARQRFSVDPEDLFKKSQTASQLKELQRRIKPKSQKVKPVAKKIPMDAQLLSGLLDRRKSVEVRACSGQLEVEQRLPAADEPAQQQSPEEDMVLTDVLETEAASPWGSTMLKPPQKTSSGAGRLNRRPGSSDSRRSSDSQTGFSDSRPSTTASVGRRNSSGSNAGNCLDRTALPQDTTPAVVKDDGRPFVTESLPQVRGGSRNMSLFIFRNADASSTGQAVLVGKVPKTMEKLLEICAQTVKPLVGPADCLVDFSFRPVRNLLEIENGGTYTLKGKEALDPPPAFFVPRHPIEEVRYKRLCDKQYASQCEALQGASRPNTSTSTFSQASFGSLFSAQSSGSRVGSMPCPHPKPLPICITWKVPDAIRKELTYGGKNQLPKHKRYDLWTVVPRRAYTESSIDLATQGSLWNDRSGI